MMNNILFLWQEAGGEAAGVAGANPLFWPFMLAAILVMYFFIIRPSAKEQKEQKSFSSNLKKGSKVVTIGGIHGTIASLEEDKITLLIAPKTVITVQRSAISLEQTKSVYGSSSATNSSKEPAKA
ncbi:MULTISPECIES: preprotein translocase subunit YajC [unclassified Aureispira]|uniref:preprotein translocase subunit YajC n=1 Tax=unclassified Aureispira TaxID=2649989 RepID=UPI0007C85E8F|nr:MULTISPECIES: preprotein translocase subunit YajC [unclassified Aureispira]WMX12080.1 preprotein translocase subunit YajC [Aureispira sp. CCB-E]